VPRKGNVPKREVLADPVYGSKVVSKLINSVMLDGKKGTAQRIVYDAFALKAEKKEKDALEVFEQAMENIMPVLEVKQDVLVVQTIKFQWKLDQSEDKR